MTRSRPRNCDGSRSTGDLGDGRPRRYAHQSVNVEGTEDPHIKAQVFGFALLAGVPGIDGRTYRWNGMVAELKPGKLLSTMISCRIFI